ncbi:type II toxin-antitoxin system RelE/ParE family toxin [Novosphingobium humi]|uniref:Type II toxin-antitoxin system RelE/ParE family toxin n=1 Tax=Novosphingobium humi TaxID=2282397 RepID=A0ABY7U2A4_9SPHN|nr:type II toxin-antitoxin system RelE/ParE family toxin [Novosphingobium humi]WCT79260.1 type II toxin-antitoxin system RelE/ParE family toxin [Novosphingobium humi]
MRRVEWAESALTDIRTQIEYIAVQDPQAARKVANAIGQTGAALGEFATGHPGRVAGTYEKLVRGLPYIIAYALTDKEQAVSILRVIHTARDWTEEAWPRA